MWGNNTKLQRYVSENVRDGRKLYFINKFFDNDATIKRRALYNAIQRARLPDGSMVVSESGMDCDCSRYSGKTHKVQATLAGFDALQNITAEWADGPFSLWPVPAGEHYIHG